MAMPAYIKARKLRKALRAAIRELRLNEAVLLNDASLWQMHRLPKDAEDVRFRWARDTGAVAGSCEEVLKECL